MPTYIIGACLLCDCDKFGITQCKVCGKWIGNLRTRAHCDQCLKAWDQSEEGKEYIWWLKGTRQLERLRYLLRHPEALQSQREESQQAKTLQS